jgi:hypothetical protein
VRRIFRLAVVALVTSLFACAADARSFDFHGSTLIADPAGTGDTMTLATGMLADDLAALSGKRPSIATRLHDCVRSCVLIGRYDAPMVAQVARAGHVDLSALVGGWERYVRAAVAINGQRILLIAGSDRRGAIYGVTDLSRALGISPWSWWADVTPRRRATVAIDDATIVSRTPSVQYRGIFLNDEDWGLEPWAAKTLDRGTGNIGAHTYERVFQLMWRLKANTLWPAMHSVSTPFYADPANAPLADRYAIVIGTSHAEPMLRNNLREWQEALRGPFDFTRRPKAILDYWRERVAATRDTEVMYTLGLRGIHDGPMQGATTTDERRAILEKVVGLQRDLLTGTLNRPPAKIPQVFVAYHELQEAYDAGLTLPSDVTLMWTDDNYGYLRRLSSPSERQRAGGAGIYYHLSYWGRPHDYLWLGTTHPALIREEMGRAWATDARRLWIVNVGDIKPIEYLSQYFLDLAFDADRLTQSPLQHLRGFMAEQFGDTDAAEIAAIMMRFYDLAWERRPEFMGFGETEWVTPNRATDYVQSDGEEAQRRLAAYDALAVRAEAVAARLPADRRDAFFELVLYPVRGAAALNERILRLDLAALYARQYRASANWYVAGARAAHASLLADTARYNKLAGGKWDGTMDMMPRRLPVFDEPLWPAWAPSSKTGCEAALWGEWIGDENTLTFTRGQPDRRTITLFAHQPRPLMWRAASLPGGVTLSATSGTLSSANGYEQRLTLSYDGRGPAGTAALACGDTTVPIHTALAAAAPADARVITERQRRVTLPALAAAPGRDWQAVPDLGSQNGALRSVLTLPSRPLSRVSEGDPATYRFATLTATGATLRVVGLPTHPLTPAQGVRIAVSIDDGAYQVLDLATVGRSDAWRHNVLTNTAIATVPVKMVQPGLHRLRLVALDPGVMLDRIELVFDRARALYGADAPDQP